MLAKDLRMQSKHMELKLSSGILKRILSALCGVIFCSCTAIDELMFEFVSKKRAAKWDVVNNGLLTAERMIASLDGKIKKGITL
jgi:hypothetical protein